MFRRVLLLSSGLLFLAAAGCSSQIPLTAPAEVKVKQVAYGATGGIELSWKLVLRVDSYLVYYDDDGPGAPYDGTGLGLAQWPSGCGDFDAGMSSPLANGYDADVGPIEGGAGDLGAGDGPLEAGARDARPAPDQLSPGPQWPGVPVDSPIEIPGVWCLDSVDTYTDAGVIPVETPGARPRIRLQHLVPGTTYFFAVKAVRGEVASDLSAEASITIKQSIGQ